MNREIETYDFFNEFLDNLETRKNICELVLWFNNNMSEILVRKYFNKNYTHIAFLEPPSYYAIKINFDYWNLDKIDLKKYILPQLNIFSKDEYFDVFKFLKKFIIRTIKTLIFKHITIHNFIYKYITIYSFV